MTHQCHEEANRAQARRSCFEAPATYINDSALSGDFTAEAKIGEPGSAMNMAWTESGALGQRDQRFFLSLTEGEPALSGGVTSERGDHD